MLPIPVSTPAGSYYIIAKGDGIRRNCGGAGEQQHPRQEHLDHGASALK